MRVIEFFFRERPAEMCACGQRPANSSARQRTQSCSGVTSFKAPPVLAAAEEAAVAMLSKVAGSRGLSKGGRAWRFVVVVVAVGRECGCWCA